jgi:hypothetical protein
MEPLSRPLLPHLKLDDLLAELQVRLQAVLTTGFTGCSKPWSR